MKFPFTHSCGLVSKNLKEFEANHDYIGEQEGLGEDLSLFNCKSCNSTISIPSLTLLTMGAHPTKQKAFDAGCERADNQ